MKTLRSTLAFLAMAALSSCATAPVSQSQPGSDLNGAWASACGNKSITRLEYTGLSLRGTYTTYEDDACKTPVAVNTWAGHSTVGSTSAEGATTIDVHFDSFNASALTPDQAGRWSGWSYCEKNDWAVGAPADVMGKKCQGFSVPVGGVNLDIYKVSGNTLVFGKDSKITATPSEADRPTVLNPYWAFQKVGNAS